MSLTQRMRVIVSMEGARIDCPLVAPSQQDKLESVLDMSHQQMEQYRDQPAHTEKIAYQQRLLQEDVVHIRAEISQLSTVSPA